MIQNFFKTFFNKDTKNVSVNNDARAQDSRSGVGLGRLSDTPLYHGFDQIKEIHPDFIGGMPPEIIARILEVNAVARNAVEYPAADCLRNWFYIADESIDNTYERDEKRHIHEKNAFIQGELRRLNVYENLYNFLKAEAATGSALMYMDVNTTTGNNFTGLKLNQDKIKKVNFLNVYDQHMIYAARVNNYMLNENFGKIDAFRLKNHAILDKSRVAYYCSRASLGNVFGTSVLIPLELSLDAQRTLLWSIGEIAQSMIFKVLKTGNVDFTKKAEYLERIRLLRETLRTNDLVAINTDEDLDFKTPGDLPRVQEMSNILWEMISCTTRVPKSILLGKTEGKVAGAEYDHLSYYIRLISLQRTAVEPVLKWIIDSLFTASGEPDVKYKIVFKPLWDISDETDAKIRKLESESSLNDAKTSQIIKLIHGLLTPEEIQKLSTGFGTKSSEGGQNE